MGAEMGGGGGGEGTRNPRVSGTSWPPHGCLVSIAVGTIMKRVLGELASFIRLSSAETHYYIFQVLH